MSRGRYGRKKTAAFAAATEIQKMVKNMQENRRKERTVQEEAAREQTYWKRNQIWTLIVAAVILVMLFTGGSGVSVVTGPEALTLTMHDGESCTVPYSAITEVRLLEEPEYGTMIAGDESRQGQSGTWEHPEWGRYTLCVYSSCTSALWIGTDDGCCVVNLSSPAETQQLYELLQEKSPVSR